MRTGNFSTRFVVLHLASLICAAVCVAGPPGGEDSSLRSQTAIATLTTRSLLPLIRPMGGSSSSRIRLDLRAPETIKPADAYSSTPNDKTSTLQIPFKQSKSPAEAMVKRVQREGLPVARLWENKAALLSVGLNQKGQPGLWLMQKTP
jgi:hypothetical protein